MYYHLWLADGGKFKTAAATDSVLEAAAHKVRSWRSSEVPRVGLL